MCDRPLRGDEFTVAGVADGSKPVKTSDGSCPAIRSHVIAPWRVSTFCPVRGPQQRHWPSDQRVSRVVETRCRRMPWRHQAVNQRLVGGVDHAVKRRRVVQPLRQLTRPGNHRTDDAVRQHPGRREVRQRNSLGLRMRLQALCDGQGFGTEFGLHHPLVTAASARVGCRCCARRVLAGQHATCHRAVRHHADAVVLAHRQDFDLGHAVQQVVVGLADHGRRHAQARREVHHLGDAPSAEVRHTPVADLAAAQGVAECTQRLLQVHARVVSVQVVDVDVVGVQTAQAVLERSHHPRPRVVAVVGRCTHRVAELGGQHPLPLRSGHQTSWCPGTGPTLSGCWSRGSGSA